jgi:hypothetical protein
VRLLAQQIAPARHLPPGKVDREHPYLHIHV